MVGLRVGLDLFLLPCGCLYLFSLLQYFKTFFFIVKHADQIFSVEVVALDVAKLLYRLPSLINPYFMWKELVCQVV